MRSQERAAIPAGDFMRLFREIGPEKLARRLRITRENVYKRRRNLEKEHGRQIVAPDSSPNRTRTGIEHPEHIPLAVKDGHVIVGSDFHYWPEIITTAHRAFVTFCRELQPKAVVLNGDVLDGARISRHAPIGWEDRPALIDEIEACKDRLDEIQKACRNADKIWTLGNHDGRFETRLATLAPEYARVHGVHLKDHFPAWRPCWATWVNNDVVIKHRWKGGEHAVWNNTIRAGKTMITGHLHSLKVTPYTDYNGTRYGVDTGTMAEPYGPQFRDYTETNPLNWRSGFVVLTFHKGRLLMPELVQVCGEDEVEFRGKVHTV